MNDKTKDDGGPFNADPMNVPLVNENDSVYGISRRDWLAGLAMQGYIAHPSMDKDHFRAPALCYELADAMIKEGKK